MSAETEEFVPFDQLRHDPEIAKRGRADIIFGPDMFDPRLEVEGWTPLTDALHKAIAQGRLEDLGVTEEALNKTVGEVWPELSQSERVARHREICGRLDPDTIPLELVPHKGFLRRMLPFAN